MSNKKGLFFWIELILLIIVLVIIAVSFPHSQNDFFASKGPVDMEKLGFTTLQSLDNAGILEEYTNSTNFEQSNFTALAGYIKASLPNTISLNIEYFNGTNCTSEYGTILATCSNVTRTKDTAVVDYAFAKLDNPITINLYLRGILG